MHTKNAFFKFLQIVPNGYVTVTEDELLYAVELAMVVAGKERNQTGELLRNLNKAMFNPEFFFYKDNRACLKLEFMLYVRARV